MADQVETRRLTFSEQPISVQQRHPPPDKLKPCAGTGHHVFSSFGLFGVVEHPSTTRCVCGERLIGDVSEYYSETRNIYEDGIEVGWFLVTLATDR